MEKIVKIYEEKHITTFYADRTGPYSDRKSDISKDTHHIIVRLYEGEVVKWTQLFPSDYKNIDRAKDYGEDWILGADVIKRS